MTNPCYIRCMRPNERKLIFSFVDAHILGLAGWSAKSSSTLLLLFLSGCLSFLVCFLLLALTCTDISDVLLSTDFRLSQGSWWLTCNQHQFVPTHSSCPDMTPCPSPPCIFLKHEPCSVSIHPYPGSIIDSLSLYPWRIFHPQRDFHSLNLDSPFAVMHVPLPRPSPLGPTIEVRARASSNACAASTARALT